MDLSRQPPRAACLLPARLPLTVRRQRGRQQSSQCCIPVLRQAVGLTQCLLCCCCYFCCC
jgi:hypothetical protein